MENINTMPTRKLPLAMRFAISGSVIAVVGALISFALSLLLKKEYTNLGKSNDNVSNDLIAIIIYAFLGVVWTCTFVGLAPLMKRIKSKALAINFIVFGALGAVVWLCGLTLPIVLDVSLSNVNSASIYVYNSTISIDPVFDHFRQLAMLALIPGLITVSGWVLVFVSGIIATTANKAELALNKK